MSEIVTLNITAKLAVNRSPALTKKASLNIESAVLADGGVSTAIMGAAIDTVRFGRLTGYGWNYTLNRWTGSVDNGTYTIGGKLYKLRFIGHNQGYGGTLSGVMFVPVDGATTPALNTIVSHIKVKLTNTTSNVTWTSRDLPFWNVDWEDRATPPEAGYVIRGYVVYGDIRFDSAVFGNTLVEGQGLKIELLGVTYI